MLQLFPLSSTTTTTVNSAAYPGTRADFVLDHHDLQLAKKGDWSLCSEGLDLVRCFEFVSKTSNALFQRIAICGYSTGMIKILVLFQEKDASCVMNYLQQKGIGVGLQVDSR